jgi:hypothetical protein
MKALEGFSVTDRRGQDHGAVERDGVEIVERDERGAECVYVMRDGKKVLIRLGGHMVETLEHSFPTCETCGQTHMKVGDEKVSCPRLGMVWTMGYGIGYGYRGQDDAKRQLDPGGLTPRTANLDGLAKLIGYTGP